MPFKVLKDAGLLQDRRAGRWVHYRIDQEALAEIEQVLGIPADQILRISAKTGVGVDALLDAVCERIPAPKGDPDAPLQALIFDSQFDQYRGVVSSIRVMNVRMTGGSRL